MDDDIRVPLHKRRDSLKGQTDYTKDQTQTPSFEESFDEPETAVFGNPNHKPENKHSGDQPKVTKRKKNPVVWFKGLSRKKKFMFVGIITGLLIGSGAGAYALMHKPKPPAPQAAQATPTPPPTPPKTSEPSKLSGVEVPLDKNKLPVVGIMIENSPDARPQAGIDQAGVVFEAIAEGGITRFLTLFQENQPEYVGPVRSVRPYYLDWVQGFDAPIAHVGGSADALAILRQGGHKDLDQAFNSAAYWRINSRYAPHNMYTSLPKLVTRATEKKFVPTNFDSFPRKAEKPSVTPTAKSIDLNLSGFLYNVHFDYDAASNSYKRSQANKPHVDEKSGQQLSPKVVVACVAQYKAAYNGVNSAYNSVGSGKVYVFQDGAMTEGTWTKTSGKSQITFADAAGKSLPLNPGQTWITFVSGADRVVAK